MLIVWLRLYGEKFVLKIFVVCLWEDGLLVGWLFAPVFSFDG